MNTKNEMRKIGTSTYDNTLSRLTISRIKNGPMHRVRNEFGEEVYQGTKEECLDYVCEQESILTVQKSSKNQKAKRQEKRGVKEARHELVSTRPLFATVSGRRQNPRNRHNHAQDDCREPSWPYKYSTI